MRVVRRPCVRAVATFPSREELAGASFMQCVQHAQKLFGEYETKLPEENVELLEAMLESSNGGLSKSSRLVECGISQTPCYRPCQEFF